MFTGIVEDVGELVKTRRTSGGQVVEIRTRLPLKTLSLGSSVAVDGVCLTVSKLGSGTFSADLSHETLAATTLGSKSARDSVHLERALTLDGRLGGHLVTGHVDGVGEVLVRESRGDNLDLVIAVPAEVAPFLVPKGSVAVDGVSLTINEPAGDRFRVTLIPHTLKGTCLGQCRPGARVNLEADLLGKYVRHFLDEVRPGRIDENFLAEHGYLDPGVKGGGRRT